MSNSTDIEYRGLSKRQVRLHFSPVLIAILFLICFPCISCSDQLGGIKGTVIDAFTRAPIAGIDITGSTQTDLESEQKYKKVSAKTGKDGTFLIKGLRDKSYQIVFSKKGYITGIITERIPDKSNRLLEKPIVLCTPPMEGRGYYIYTTDNKYVKLKNVTPKMSDNSQQWDRRIYYDKTSLSEIAPSSPKYIAYYDPNSSSPMLYDNTQMYKLFKTNNITDQHIQSDMEDGEYFTVSSLYSSINYGGYNFNCSATQNTMQISGPDGRRIPYQFNQRAIYCTDYYSQGIKLNTIFQVFDLNTLQEGYYYIGRMSEILPDKSFVLLIKK